MAPSDAQKRAAAKWKANRDSITIRPTKEVGSSIRKAASAAGVSVQQYILKAISFFMNSDKAGE